MTAFNILCVQISRSIDVSPHPPRLFPFSFEFSLIFCLCFSSSSPHCRSLWNKSKVYIMNAWPFCRNTPQPDWNEILNLTTVCVCVGEGREHTLSGTYLAAVFVATWTRSEPSEKGRKTNWTTISRLARSINSLLCGRSVSHGLRRHSSLTWASTERSRLILSTKC